MTEPIVAAQGGVRRQHNRWLGAGAFVVLMLGTAVLVRLATSEPIPAHRSVEPSPTAPGALAYSVDGDIYVAEWDGANPVRIADGDPATGDDECGKREYRTEGPIWSPDGRYLAYWGGRCWVGNAPEGTVVISDPEGHLIASFPGEGWQIAWSPDSTRIAVWVRWGETIGVYGLDAARQTVLPSPRGLMPTGDHDPVWSPDGRSLLVPVGVEIPLDGSAPRQLPWARRSFEWMTFSPDGSRVAYGTRYPADGALVVARADGSLPEEMFGGWIYKPVWSSTGDRIAFTSEVPNDQGTFLHEGTALRVLDASTGAVTLLAESEEAEVLWAIAFSRESDRILFSRAHVRSGVNSLWSIAADGSDLRRLVPETGGQWAGDWQPLDPAR
jgi:Tol biopolymer transport system component